MEQIILLVLTGISAGFLSSFFGVGGGPITIPVLLMLFPQFSIKDVIPISLGLILANSINNMYLYWKKNLAPTLKTISIMSIFGLLGSAVAYQTFHFLDAKTIQYFFAFIVLASGIKNLLPDQQSQLAEAYDPIKWKVGLTGLFGATLAGITGLGGGIIYIPLFINFVKVPIQKIPAYSNMGMMIGSSFGLLPHLFAEPIPFKFKLQFFSNGHIGRVNILIVLILFTGALISSRLGVKLNNKIKTKTKKLLLAVLLITLALKTLLT